MVCASFVTGSFVAAAVAAFHLWRGHYPAANRMAFSMSMWMALLLVPVQMVIGDLHGRNTMEYQPTKLAAMEGLWDTTHGPAMTVIAWPDMAEARNLYAIDIPHLASLHLTHSWDGEVQGLKAVPPSDRPNVPIVFFAFRIMVGIAIVLLATAITGAVLRWRGRLYDTRWFQFVTMATGLLGFIAVLAGWITTEAGRQPWIVYGHLRTADAVSPVTAHAVAVTLAGFFVIYLTLLLVFVWFTGKIALRGPVTADRADPRQLRPGLDRSAPTIVAAPPAGPLPGPKA